MFTEHQINTMVRMQNEMNCITDPQWRDKGYPWLRAARMEAAEAIDHYQWKWWKEKGEPDIAQVKLEVVDIWHFILSFRMEETSESIFEYVKLYESDVEHAEQASWTTTIDRDPVYLLDYLIESTYKNSFYYTYVAFAVVALSLDMTGDEVFKLYLAKNVLNKFRQDHGYKEGTYIKNWQGREDNEHLTEIMETLDLDHPDVELNLRREIANRYQALSI